MNTTGTGTYVPTMAALYVVDVLAITHAVTVKLAAARWRQQAAEANAWANSILYPCFRQEEQ